MGPIAPRNRRGFKIAVICALPVEAESVCAAFDKCWEDEGKWYGKAKGDKNTYTTGTIGRYNVVLVHMADMGGIHAAQSATNLGSSFPAIELVLIVGVCGVVPLHPETREEIVLGDVVVSTAVTQYDFGRLEPGGFKRKTQIQDSMRKAPEEIRGFMNKLSTRQYRKKLREDLHESLSRKCIFKDESAIPYPGAAQDHLYEPSYLHQHRPFVQCDICHGVPDVLCSLECNRLGCGTETLVPRKRHQFSSEQGFAPAIHLGRYGTANTVVKSGLDRDRLARNENLVAFEMESAGIWDTYATIVIKGACDYADSHKNKIWQPYAAMTAAACLRVVLAEWVVADELVDLENMTLESFIQLKKDQLDFREELPQHYLDSHAWTNFHSLPLRTVAGRVETLPTIDAPDPISKPPAICSDTAQILQDLLQKVVYEQNVDAIRTPARLNAQMIQAINQWLATNATPFRYIEHHDVHFLDHPDLIAARQTTKALTVADVSHVLHIFPKNNENWSNAELFLFAILSIVQKLILLLPEDLALEDPAWDCVSAATAATDITISQCLALLRQAIGIAPEDTHLILLDHGSVLAALDTEDIAQLFQVLRSSTQHRGFKALFITQRKVDTFVHNLQSGEARVIFSTTHTKHSPMPIVMRR